MGAGRLREDGAITYTAMRGRRETAVVSEASLHWERMSPFRSEDAVMVLSFAIIMLTTNLNSANVKNKMKKNEFLKQNREVNAGANFPGDFLSEIYDSIKQEELKVMRTGV